MTRIFVLSPARLDGQRAKLLFDRDAGSAIAAALRSREGAAIGEVFRFISGLYFRGKLAYATRFARPPRGSWVGSGALVMTANAGMLPVETRVRLRELQAFAEIDIAHDEPRFRVPLERDTKRLAELIGPRGQVVLLGSVASKKYLEPLHQVLDARLLFPPAFVGRGDMSRGGLLLRAVEAGTELDYAPVGGAVQRGARPPKLPARH